MRPTLLVNFIFAFVFVCKDNHVLSFSSPEVVSAMGKVNNKQSIFSRMNIIVGSSVFSDDNSHNKSENQISDAKVKPEEEYKKKDATDSIATAALAFIGFGLAFKVSMTILAFVTAALGNEIVREVGNVAGVASTVGGAVAGAAVEGAKVAAPIVGKAVVSGVKAATPVVQAASQAVSDAASPYVEEATNVITEAASPYIDSVSSTVDSTIRDATGSVTNAMELTIIDPIRGATASITHTVSDSISKTMDSAVVAPIKETKESLQVLFPF